LGPLASKYHTLNPQIPPEYRTLNSSQYLQAAAAQWFESLGQRYETPGDNFDDFVQLFINRWDELNWQDKALRRFHALKQEGSNTDIESYNMAFQAAYQAIAKEISEYTAVRTYTAGLKPRTQADLERS